MPVSPLQGLGVFDPESLSALSSAGTPYLIDGLIGAGSINLIVGDSGLGKTPLLVQMGVCVASGLPFFGRPTVPGRVLYVDCESSPGSFAGIIASVSAYLGLSKMPPEFLTYSPNWDSRPDKHPEPVVSVAAAIQELRPTLVIIDPLRVVWPRAEMKSEDTITMIAQQRALASETGCTIVNIHHCRKPNQENPHPISLAADPHGWLLEAAGSRALINQTDTRLGLIRGNDLLMAGFTRVAGPIPPITIRRILDEDSGDPIAYEGVTGREALSEFQKTFLEHLPTDFSTPEAKLIYSNMHEGHPNDRETVRHLKALSMNGLIRHRGGRKGFEKTLTLVESTT